MNCPNCGDPTNAAELCISCHMWALRQHPGPPDDPELSAPGPHERAGILRANRVGWTSEQLADMFMVSNVDILKEIAEAVQQEAVAYTAGLPMH